MAVRIFMLVAGIAGCCGVALGALAAHALRERLEPAALASLDTAAKYLLLHAAALLAVAGWVRLVPDALLLRLAGGMLCAGMILFCGGLSIAALSGARGFTVFAPAGGMALMAGWLTLAVYAAWKI